MIPFLFFVASSQAEVGVYRSMEMNQIDYASYELTCVAEYSGIDPALDYEINLFIGGDGVTTRPTGTQVGPSQRKVSLENPGVWSFQVQMKGRTITARRILYINYQASISASFFCEGRANSLSPFEILPSFVMSDSSR